LFSKESNKAAERAKMSIVHARVSKKGKYSNNGSRKKSWKEGRT